MHPSKCSAGSEEQRVTQRCQTSCFTGDESHHSTMFMERAERKAQWELRGGE